MTLIGVTLRMDAEDFVKLTTNSAERRGPEVWADWGPERFRPMPKKEWPYAYWFATWGDVILARAFLTAVAYGGEVGGDEVEDGGWVIFTDYKPMLVRQWARARQL